MVPGPKSVAIRLPSPGRPAIEFRLGGGTRDARLGGPKPSPFAVCSSLSLLADGGHDGSERTVGSRTPKDERSESFGIRTEGRRSRACGLTSFGRSGLRLPGFEFRYCCSLSLADSEHDGIRTEGRRSCSLRSLRGLRLLGFEPISVRCLLVASAPRRTAGTIDSNPRPSDVFPRRERDADRSPTLCPN